MTSSLFVHGATYSNQVRALFDSGVDLKCAVAFWGEEAFNLLKSYSGKADIICNLESGAVNPYVIKKLMQEKSQNVIFKTSSSLHAKVYLAPSSAIVGSANASANGLGLEDDEAYGWQEAGMMVSDVKNLEDIEKWFQKIWKSSPEITSAMVDQAKSNWAYRRNVRPAANTSKNNLATNGSLLAHLKANPNFYKERNYYFLIYTSWASKEARDTFNIAVENLPSTSAINRPKNRTTPKNLFSFFENWGAIPSSSNFISLYVGARGGFKCELFTTPVGKARFKFSYEDGDAGHIDIVKAEECLNGLKLSKDEIENVLRPKAKALLDTFQRKHGDKDCIIPFYDAYHILFGQTAA